MNNRNEELFDQLIRHAAGKWLDDMTDDCQTDVEPVRDIAFSDAFLAWADKTVAREERRSRGRRLHTRLFKTAKGIGIAACLLAAVFTLAAFTISPVRVALSNYLIEQQQGYVMLHIGCAMVAGNDGSCVNSMFGYLPDGYELTSLTDNDAAILMTFKNGSGGEIRFERQKGSESVIISGDSQKVDVDGMEGAFSSRDGMNVLAFHDATYNYILSSQLNRDELFRIAENINK